MPVSPEALPEYLVIINGFSEAIEKNLVPIAALAATFFTTTKVSKINAVSAQAKDSESREYTAKGYRRKLNSLMARSASRIHTSILYGATSADALQINASKDLYEFTMTTELASAVHDDKTLGLVYTYLDKLEVFGPIAKNLCISVPDDFANAVDEGRLSSDEEFSWPLAELKKMVTMHLEPLKVARSYFKHIGNLSQVEEIDRSISYGEAVVKDRDATL